MVLPSRDSACVDRASRPRPATPRRAGERTTLSLRGFREVCQRDDRCQSGWQRPWHAV